MTNPAELCQRILLLTAAAMHTSCTQMVFIFYDLSAMREQIGLLRQEVKAVLSANNGAWSFEIVQQLSRMDSFLKESQRWNPSDLLGCGRKAMVPLVLPDGKTRLPARTKIQAAATEMANDPVYHADPRIFKPEHFLSAAKHSAGKESVHTSIEPGNISWGAGRYTCPGRWYANTMMKLILAKMLVACDFAFPDGQNERPEVKVIDTRVLPNLEQKIVFTSRMP